jgi:hypothetical protein
MSFVNGEIAPRAPKWRAQNLEISKFREFEIVKSINFEKIVFYGMV